MSKNKTKFTKESDSASEPKSLSTLLILETLFKKIELERREKEKKEAAEEAMRTRCRLCFKEIAPKRVCGGHGGGGGCGGDEEYDESFEAVQSPTHNPLMTDKPNFLEWADVLYLSGQGTEVELDSQLNEESFNPEIIAGLIENGSLIIQLDRESKSLTLEWKNDLPIKQQQELKKYIHAVLKEFKQFKEEHQLTDECLKLTQNTEENRTTLTLNFPTPVLYDAFIRRLADNLIPTPKPEVELNEEHQKVQTAALTPFSIEPKPGLQSSEEEEEVGFHPVPSPCKIDPH